MNEWLVAIAFSVLFFVTVGTQSAFASTITIDEGATMTVGSDSTVTINTDDSNFLDNQGILNVEDTGLIQIQNNANMLNDCTGTTNVDSAGTIDIGSDTDATLTNHGTINGPGQINLFGINLLAENSGIITALINPISALMQILSPCSDTPTPPVGGNIIPIDTTSLLLAGGQTIMVWLIPVLVSVAVIGLFLVRKKEVIH